MKTIYKYPIVLSSDATPISLYIPDGRVLCVGQQDGRIFLWAQVDTRSPDKLRTFRAFGTGDMIPDDIYMNYVGTVHIPPFVWHVYETFE